MESVAIVKQISKRIVLCLKYWFFKLNYDLFCPNWSYHGQKYQNVPQVLKWKIVAISYVLFYQLFCIWPNYKASLFQIYIIELEACYSYSWSLIFSPLILVSVLMKTKGTSGTVINNSMRVENLSSSLYKGKKIK